LDHQGIDIAGTHLGSYRRPSSLQFAERHGVDGAGGWLMHERDVIHVVRLVAPRMGVK
jgi:hypothetical protein